MVNRDVLLLAIEFKRAMGHGFTFTKKNTEFHKTYSYKHLDRFYTKMLNDGFNVDECKAIIIESVNYIKKYKLAKLGTAILSKSDIVEICINNIKNDDCFKDQVFSELTDMNNVVPLDKRSEFLSGRISRNGIHKIVQLYNSKVINHNFISLSKSCRDFIINNKSEQSWFKKINEYNIVNAKLMNKFTYDRLSEIFKHDLFRII